MPYRISLSLLAFAVVTASQTAINAESFSTNFTGLTPDADAPDLGPIDFPFPEGEVQFFANGPYYVPGSNRAWGFSGQGQTNIAFGDFSGGVPSLLADANNHANAVTISLRGSLSGTRNNRGGFDFVDSQVGFVWYDENNVRWLGGVTADGLSTTTASIDNGAGAQDYISVANSGYQQFVIDPTVVGVESVSRIRLVNGVDDSAAFALLGDIRFTTVPEPTAALLGVGAVMANAATFRRRRSGC